MPKDHAISETITHHQQGLYRYLLVIGAEADLAQDLAQEAFMALFLAHKKGTFKKLSHAETAAWLRRAGKHKLIDHRRKKGPLPLEIEVLDQAWQELTPNEDVEARLARMKRCRSELPERSALAIELRYDEGMDSDAIAQRLETTSDGLRSLLKRARSLLRECMEKHHED